MRCNTCTRAQTSRLRFFCPTCARNQLYQLRVENATVLLEREQLGQQIETAVNPSSNPEEPSSNRERIDAASEDGSSRLWALQGIANGQAQSSIRIKVLASQIESLRSEIKNKKFDISQRKLELARRRSDAESAKYQLAEREAAVLAGIQNNIKRTDHLWHSLHSKTAEARIFLCREAANLYGLRQRVKKRDKGVRESYTLGGISIIDLRDLNGAAPDHISTSFSYVAHILVLISHYLSLRLPAEITLPHRNYSSPTIYTPSASYLPRETYSASSSDQSSSSPTTSRTSDIQPRPPRPRPLCIDKTLPKLAKENPGTYALFIEGVTLLAWDVSWLCRSQGLNIGSDSWEDICNIGKNLWQLLVAPPGQPSTLVRALAGRDIQSKIKTPKDSPRTTIQRTKSFPMLGHYSHGTVHSFLGASEGTEFIRSWRLPPPAKVVDRLKSTLLGEMASAEWELLEENEWDDIPQDSNQPVPREPTHDRGITRDPQPTIADTESLAPKLEASDAPTHPSRSRGTSGWTKLRNR